MLATRHVQKLNVVKFQIRSNAAHFSEDLLKHLQICGITSSELGREALQDGRWVDDGVAMEQRRHEL
jgi:hypothetical protein